MSRPALHLVRQQDQHGCALACMAMVLGRSYEDVRADFGDPRFGHTYTTWGAYLAERGYATQHFFRHDPIKAATRDPWPLAPWADMHLCSVDAGRGDGSHLVVMTRCGEVFDPVLGRGHRLSNYPSVAYMAAVFATGLAPKAVA